MLHVVSANFLIISHAVTNRKCTETLTLYFLCRWKHEKKPNKSRIPYRNFRNFQYCRPAQNQTKFQIIFHKNSSPHDLYTMNLIACMQTFVRNCWIEFRVVCNEVLNGTTSIALSRIRVNISWSNFENIVSK